MNGTCLKTLAFFGSITSGNFAENSSGQIETMQTNVAFWMMHTKYTIEKSQAHRTHSRKNAARQANHQNVRMRKKRFTTPLQSEAYKAKHPKKQKRTFLFNKRPKWMVCLNECVLYDAIDVLRGSHSSFRWQNEIFARFTGSFFSLYAHLCRNAVVLMFGYICMIPYSKVSCVVSSFCFSATVFFAVFCFVFLLLSAWDVEGSNGAEVIFIPFLVCRWPYPAVLLEAVSMPGSISGLQPGF